MPLIASIIHSFNKLYRNPNSPISLPDGIPVWPQFNSKQMKVITTPNKSRLEMLADVLCKDRDAQLHLEKFTSNI